MIDFGRIAGVIMDMDGVLWRGDQALPDLGAWFDFLRARGLRYVMATNNSRLAPVDYIEKLARMGIHGIEADQIITSGTATVAYVQAHFPAGSLIHVLGGDGLRMMLSESGYAVTSEIDPHVVAVTVGVDFALTYDKLKNASMCIRAGAAFIATNNDATFPTPEGLVPGAGSIVAALRTASGVEPMNMGKPNAPMFEAALRALGMDAGDALMVGDRLDTDIAGAAALGIQTVLVLTGVSTLAEVAAAAGQPDGVYAGLGELVAAWS